MTEDYSRRPIDYSYEQVYDLTYSMNQLKKFLLRRDNHWKVRINNVLESLSLFELTGNRALDLGTSVGTFAVELAQRDYQVTGVDADEKAIGIARLMAEHYGLTINYVTADASIRDTFTDNSFDVIIAEDIFEHLHDDVLEKVLSNCYHWLGPGGYLIFHTFPSRFDYIFHGSKWWIPLVLLAWMNDSRFCRVVEIYNRSLFNPWRKLRTGKTPEESIRYTSHCNLLTATNLKIFLEKAGLLVLKLETRNLYPWSVKGIKRRLFRHKQYFQRNITGICWRPLRGLTTDSKS